MDGLTQPPIAKADQLGGFVSGGGDQGQITDQAAGWGRGTMPGFKLFKTPLQIGDRLKVEVGGLGKLAFKLVNQLGRD